MFDLDVNTFRSINDLAGYSAFWDRIFVFSSKYSVVVFALVLVYYLFKNRQIFWAAFFSAILSRGIITEIIRFFYDRPRPFVALENVAQLVEKNGSEPSFPSGHAAFLFAIAVSVGLFDKRAGTVLLVLAFVFTFARVFTGIHYPLDIVGGLVIGVISAWIVKLILSHLSKQKTA